LRFLREAAGLLPGPVPTLSAYEAWETQQSIAWVTSCPGLQALQVAGQLRDLEPPGPVALRRLHVHSLGEEELERLLQLELPSLVELGLRNVDPERIDLATHIAERLRTPELLLGLSAIGGRRASPPPGLSRGG
jgi:hypothetical protein